jgi:DNA-directed RNA polymerase subunit RPC12/RpoP
MVEILQKMFENSSDKSKLILNDICSDCKKKIVIQIMHTSGGFGLLGGALFEDAKGGYYAKCPTCYHLSPTGR